MALLQSFAWAERGPSDKTRQLGGDIE
jgi:hypothetical protein